MPIAAPPLLRDSGSQPQTATPTPISASSATTRSPPPSSSQRYKPNSPTSPPCVTTPPNEAGTPKSPPTPVSSPASKTTSTDSPDTPAQAPKLDPDIEGRLIEIYFSVVQRKLLAPDHAASLENLTEQLTAFEARYNQTARPIDWRFQPTRPRPTPRPDRRLTTSDELTGATTRDRSPFVHSPDRASIAGRQPPKSLSRSWAARRTAPRGGADLGNHPRRVAVSRRCKTSPRARGVATSWGAAISRAVATAEAVSRSRSTVVHSG
jgi:hypothetical protein